MAGRGFAGPPAADPRTLLELYAWTPDYRTVAGLIPLPIGYAQAAPVPVDRWLADHRH